MTAKPRSARSDTILTESNAETPAAVPRPGTARAASGSPTFRKLPPIGPLIHHAYRGYTHMERLLVRDIKTDMMHQFKGLDFGNRSTYIQATLANILYMPETPCFVIPVKT